MGFNLLKLYDCLPGELRARENTDKYNLLDKLTRKLGISLEIIPD